MAETLSSLNEPRREASHVARRGRTRHAALQSALAEDCAQHLLRTQPPPPMATGIVPQPFRVLSRIRPEHTPSHGPRDSWHSERTIRTRRLYQKTTEPSRFGPARTVPSSSGGGAMTTALQGAELDVLSDDSEFVL